MRIDKIDGKQDTEPFHDLESRTSLWVNVSMVPDPIYSNDLLRLNYPDLRKG